MVVTSATVGVGAAAVAIRGWFAVTGDDPTDSIRTTWLVLIASTFVWRLVSDPFDDRSTDKNDYPAATRPRYDRMHGQINRGIL